MYINNEQYTVGQLKTKKTQSVCNFFKRKFMYAPK